MSDFFGKLKSGAGKVAFEAEKMTRLNRARGELDKIKDQIQAQYLKLGETYYKQREAIGATGSAYDEICQAIMTLEQQVEAKNLEIQGITAEVYSPQVPQQAAQPAPGTTPPVTAPAPAQYTPQVAPTQPATSPKFCTNCGKEIPPETKFCPDCGTKVPA